MNAVTSAPSQQLAEMMVAALEVDDDDPKTYKKAMKLRDAEARKEACVAEVQSLIDNKVFEVVDRPNKR